MERSMRCIECSGRMEKRIVSLLRDKRRSNARRIVEQLIADVSVDSAKQLTKKEASIWEAQGVSSRQLTYGEVSFWSFVHILLRLKPEHSSNFYDLGSGTGRAVFIASLACEFKRSVGIEIVESLHQVAVNRLAKLKQLRDNDRKSLQAGDGIELICGDIFKESWSDGDVVFVASTAFDDDLMGRLGKACESLKRGAVVITLSKKLPSKAFVIEHSAKYRMSWSPAVTVFFQARS
mmetsp:Transcript_4469/g.7985  ORF Transcript_4469/g.7985 Transcript_4469/m.7985 type:complete len:235 (-) Transcript_4469:273-977(-)